MKDLSYFKEKIDAKLDCAEEFSEMAVEVKTSHPKIARVLMDMSDMELKMAEKLEFIMDEMYGGIQTDGYGGNDYNDYHHELMQRYSAARNNVRNMKDMYSRRQGGTSNFRHYDGRNNITGRYY